MELCTCVRNMCLPLNARKEKVQRRATEIGSKITAAAESNPCIAYAAFRAGKPSHTPLCSCARFAAAPGVVLHLLDREARRHIAIQHGPHQRDAALAHDPGHTQLAVKYLIDAVEGALLVDQRVEQDAQRPHVLLFAPIGLALKHFGCSVIWNNRQCRECR